MKSVMVDLLEGVIWLVVCILVVAGGVGGYGFGSVYQGGSFIQGWFGVGIGAIAGLCVASLVCGPMFILLQMRDSLKSLKEQANN